MDLSNVSSRIDRGRLAAVAAFTALMMGRFFSIQKELGTLFPVDATKVLTLAHSLLTAGLYLLIVAVYFLRTSAGSTTSSFPAKFIAVFASFLPLLIPLVSKTAWPNQPMMLLVSSAVMLAGSLYTLVALGALGKSFSIIPQSRKLIVSGPYRLSRHPVYAGEITGVLGLTLGSVSIVKSLLFCLFVGCQAYRASQEEKLLSAAFPEYSEYAAKTARFFPGLF